jgi:hypothetical protein
MVFETERDMYQKIADKIKKILWKWVEEKKLKRCQIIMTGFRILLPMK